MFIYLTSSATEPCLHSFLHNQNTCLTLLLLRKSLTAPTLLLLRRVFPKRMRSLLTVSKTKVRDLNVWDRLDSERCIFTMGQLWVKHLKTSKIGLHFTYNLANAIIFIAIILRARWEGPDFILLDVVSARYWNRPTWIGMLTLYIIR